MEISNRDLKWLTLLTREGVVTKKLDEIGKFYPISKNYPRKKDNLDFENSSSILRLFRAIVEIGRCSIRYRCDDER